MDRATLLQIFQSRLERSDYSKLQKQGRTFYQEARRQASNTQARHISVSFLFRSRRRSVRHTPRVCVPLLAIVAVYSVWFRPYFRVFPVYVSAFFTGPVVVPVAVVVFRACRRILFLSFFFHFFFPFFFLRVFILYRYFCFFLFCSCIANVLSILRVLVTFRRS